MPWPPGPAIQCDSDTPATGLVVCILHCPSLLPHLNCQVPPAEALMRAAEEFQWLGFSLAAAQPCASPAAVALQVIRWAASLAAQVGSLHRACVEVFVALSAQVADGCRDLWLSTLPGSVPGAYPSTVESTVPQHSILELAEVTLRPTVRPVRALALGKGPALCPGEPRLQDPPVTPQFSKWDTACVDAFLSPHSRLLPPLWFTRSHLPHSYAILHRLTTSGRPNCKPSTAICP